MKITSDHVRISSESLQKCELCKKNEEEADIGDYAGNTLCEECAKKSLSKKQLKEYFPQN